MCNSELGVTLRPTQGSRCPAEYLTDLDYADDIAQVLLQKLEIAAATVGLTVNQSKTKAMIIGDKSTGEQILLKTGHVEIVDNFCYLGSWIAILSKSSSSSSSFLTWPK